MIRIGKRILDIDKDWLYQKYWGEKLTLKEIGKLCNCSLQAIWYYMKRNGIKTRTMSEVATGRILSTETRDKIRKARTGIPRSKETIEKMRKAITGYKHTEEAKRKMSRMRSGKKLHHKIDCLCVACRRKRGEYRREKHPNWKGGISKEDALIRTSPKYKEWRNGVFGRDNYTCVRCLEYGNGNLNAHHILLFALFPEERFELSNGATLCEKCHKYIHLTELRGEPK